MKRSLTAILAVALLLGGFVLGLTSIASAQNDNGPSTTDPDEETPSTTAPEDESTTVPEEEEESTETTPPTTTAPETDEAPDDEVPEGPTPIDPEQFEAFRQCMADNGVDLPEPPEPGTGPPTERPPRPELDRETLDAAREACKDLLPDGARFGHGPGGPGGPGCNRGPGGPGGPGSGPRGDEDGTEGDGSSDTAPATPEAENSSFAGAV